MVRSAVAHSSHYKAMDDVISLCVSVLATIAMNTEGCQPCDECAYTEVDNAPLGELRIYVECYLGH